MIRRCAIYTRKSTEEGLDQAFNSLDAQRESCEAFIASQRGEGWRAVKARYDDGGISGGHMERPGLKALLADIDDGKIDIVVVYKVDRLTRSLADFAKLVERFDKHEVSFVSVTQAFNTSNSMGRLTLNVLLSFAQFEREVGAERVRDKIAASRKKGMWTGGNPPLGYHNIDKKLIVVESEAAIVRELYTQYDRHGAVQEIIAHARRVGWLTKRRANGSGGLPLSRGPIYHILKNPVYAGLMRSGNQLYEGQHEAIIEREQWERVQEKISGRTQWRGPPKNKKSPLAGILSWKNQRLTPEHAKKAGRRYRYYVTGKNEFEKSKSIRLKADDVEAAVARAIDKWTADADAAANDILKPGASAQVSARVKKAVAWLAITESSPPSQRCQELRPFIKTVSLNEEVLALTLDVNAMLKDADADDALLEEFTIRKAVEFRNCKLGARLILGGCERPETPDESISTLLARAHRWKKAWFENPNRELKSIIKEDGGDATTTHRVLTLAFLAPDIVDALIRGDGSYAVSAEDLRRLSEMPTCWVEQREMLSARSKA